MPGEQEMVVVTDGRRCTGRIYGISLCPDFLVLPDEVAAHSTLSRPMTDADGSRDDAAALCPVSAETLLSMQWSLAVLLCLRLLRSSFFLSQISLLETAGFPPFLSFSGQRQRYCCIALYKGVAER